MQVFLAVQTMDCQAMQKGASQPFKTRREGAFPLLQRKPWKEFAGD
jgi:hypothetical protein